MIAPAYSRANHIIFYGNKEEIHILLLAAIFVCPAVSWAQKEDFNPIETGVTSLGIAPDARGAAMGDIGAATDPDANSQFWNPSKYALPTVRLLLP